MDAGQWRLPLSAKRCENVLRHQAEYRQIEHDSPNLIWLYTLILKEEVKLPRGEIISAMKQRLLEEASLTPFAWRYIANGTADDFRFVLDSTDPGETSNWQWKILIYWLQILSCLKRQSPIPEPIQRLFLNDSLLVVPEYGEVDFRGAWMKFDTLRHILAEGEKRLAAGTFAHFAEQELVEVLTWLASTHAVLDNNQTRAGWASLARRAAEWKADVVTMAKYRNLNWTSTLPEMQFDRFTVEPAQ